MDVEFSQNGASGVITLNRPDALNALTLSMVRDMTPLLNDWARDPSIEHVVIEGAGEKSFCAGGDIRALHDWGHAGEAEATGFYREEYALNHLVKTFPKPYIALIDGITMGGGVVCRCMGGFGCVPKIRFSPCRKPALACCRMLAAHIFCRVCPVLSAPIWC